MKRSYRIGLALILILMMVFTSTGMAFAASNSQGEEKTEPASYTDQEIPDGEQGAESDMTEDEILELLDSSNDEIDEDAPEMQKGNSLSENLPVHRILNYSDVTLTPDVTLRATTSRNGKYVAETSYVQLKKGTFYLAGYTNKNDVTIAVVDRNGNLVGGSSYSWYYANRNYWNSFQIPSTGYYYVITICKTKSTYTYLRATLAVDLQGLYLGNNKYYVVGHSTGAETRTYKFYPKSTGYMRIYTDDKSKITVCNASGKVIAKQVTVNYTPVFGVRADRTYLLKVAWPSGSQGMNRIKVVNGSWWPANGVSKAKATTLTKGKAQKGLVVAGENNVRWFKFTNWQSYTKITVTGGTNDQLVWYIYEGNKQISRRIFTPSLSKMWTSFTAKKGVTYYVKVQKLTGTSSGYYHVKFE